MKRDELTRFVAKHPRLFVLTGAGCSTASGLGDYRDQQGKWKRKQPITGQTFIQNSDARKRYWARSSVGWPSFAAAKPSEAHFAIARLQTLDHAQTLITQNVDELHQKAGHKNVVDLHGVLSTVSCIDCRNQIPPSVIVQDAMQALAQADALLIAGSSLMVYSGFRFCRKAQALGIPIAIVNNGQTRADSLATLKSEGDCGQLLSQLADDMVK